MSLVRKDKLEIKLAGYSVGTPAALVDPTLLTRTQDYKRHTASRMIPLEAADVPKRLSSADYHVTMKIDGEFSVLAYEDGEAILVNPGGTVRVGLALGKEAADKLKAAGIKKALFAGELYYSRPDGKRGRVHDVSRIARQPATKAELDGLNFAPFDIIEIDGTPPTAVFRDTWARLESLFKGCMRVVLPEAHWIKDGGDIAKQFKAWVNGGAEGLIARSDSAGMFKVKPRHTLDAVVIGFTEGVDDRHGMIHDLLLAMMRQDGFLHVLGHVGGGFTEQDRRAFLSDLKDSVTASEYVEVNDQVAYHMVRPEIVIEISVLDMISHSTRGTPMNKMALNWDAVEKKYKIVRRLPLVALISPQFVRKRDDKQFNASDIRIKQVSDLVEVPLVDRDARQLNLTPSSPLKREVYTKVLKGATMVRKFVMWETNKQADADDFPAYVIHFSDFSPNRKTPLERDIRVSNSRDQIDSLWTELLTENIAKGWAPHVGSGVVAAPVPVAETTVAAVPNKRGKAADAESEPEVTEETAVTKPAPKKRAAPKKKDA